MYFEWDKSVYFMFYNYYALMICLTYVYESLMVLCHTILGVAYVDWCGLCVWHQYSEYMTFMNEVPCKIYKD